MGSTSTRGVARQFIQAWHAGHLHIVDELAAPNLTVSYTHFPEAFEGPEAFKEMLSQTHQYFPDLSIEIREVVSDENEAVVYWTYRDTFQEGEMFGVSASGQSVEVAGMTLYQISDGKVKSGRGMVDNFNLMMQLGARPNPRGKQ